MKNKILVAYFSASGVTESVAKLLAKSANADLYEIKPSVPYTPADLNWRDKNSRSSVEMRDPQSRPAILNKVDNMEQYDTVFVGFPIWWYVAPTIINTFLESYNFSGKTVIPFATSGGSGLGNTEKILHSLCPETTKWHKGKILNGKQTEEALSAWISEVTLK